MMFTVETPLAAVLLRAAIAIGGRHIVGMLCLAAPVWNHTGPVVAAVGITTLTMVHTHASMVKEYTEPVLAACRKSSRTLGYVGSPKARGKPAKRDLNGTNR
jgi:DNA-binding IclR family transcriptional regulator